VVRSVRTASVDKSINYLRRAGITAAWCDEDGVIRVRVRGVEGTVALRSNRDPVEVLATIACTAKDCTFMVPLDGSAPSSRWFSTRARQRLYRGLIATALSSLVLGAMMLPNLPVLWELVGVLFCVTAVTAVTAAAVWPGWSSRPVPKCVVLGTDGIQLPTGLPAYIPWEHVKQTGPTQWVMRVAPDRWAPLRLPHDDFGFRSRVAEIQATRGKAVCRSLNVPHASRDPWEDCDSAGQVDLTHLLTPGDGADSYRPLASSVTDSELVDMVEDASVTPTFRIVAARLVVARGVVGAKTLVRAAANATVHAPLAAALAKAAG